MNQSRKPPREDVHVCRRAATEGLGEALRQHVPLPDRGFGEDQLDRARHEPVHLGEDGQVVAFPPHLRRLFANLSPADVDRFEKLISLDPKTIAWIAEKNTRELTQLDGAVEFITSSRTAARVLMWVCGTAVAFVAGVVTLTKNGIDLFQIVRGGK